MDMTHGNDDNTRIDGHKILNLPFGIHLDSVEAKWLIVSLGVGFFALVTNNASWLQWWIIGALGIRAAPKPESFKAYKRQPWFAVFGTFVGIVIGYAATSLGLSIDAHVAVPEMLDIISLIL